MLKASNEVFLTQSVFVSFVREGLDLKKQENTVQYEITHKKKQKSVLLLWVILFSL